MSQGKLVSIVTAYFNREDWVENTLDSLISQTYENIEIVAVDDCSTDGTYERLQAYSKKDSRIKVIKNVENKGFVQTMIDALEECSGEYIAIQGSGDISLPKRIEEQVKVLDEKAGVGLVGCLRRVVNKTNLDKLYSFKSDSWIEGEHFSGNASEVILKRNLFAHGSVMFRADLYHKIGGYRKEFTFAQDRDLWIRLSKCCDFHVVDEVLYERYFIPGSVTIDPNKRLIQRYFSELAVQCGKEKEGRRDLVQRFGANAPFFFDRTRDLSIDLAKSALKWKHQEDEVSAEVFSSAAIKQNLNIITILTNFVVSHVPKPISRIILSVIFKLLRIAD